jgi:hypothetical protein
LQEIAKRRQRPRIYFGAFVQQPCSNVELYFLSKSLLDCPKQVQLLDVVGVLHEPGSRLYLAAAVLEYVAVPAK